MAGSLAAWRDPPRCSPHNGTATGRVESGGERGNMGTTATTLHARAARQTLREALCSASCQPKNGRTPIRFPFQRVKWRPFLPLSTLRLVRFFEPALPVVLHTKQCVDAALTVKWGRNLPLPLFVGACLGWAVLLLFSHCRPCCLWGLTVFLQHILCCVVRFTELIPYPPPVESLVGCVLSATAAASIPVLRVSLQTLPAFFPSSFTPASECSPPFKILVSTCCSSHF